MSADGRAVRLGAVVLAATLILAGRSPAAVETAKAADPDRLGPAPAAQPGTDAWTHREDDNFHCSQQGQNDANTSPAFAEAAKRMFAEQNELAYRDDNEWDPDPLRYPPLFWDEKRGHFAHITFTGPSTPATTGFDMTRPPGWRGNRIYGQLFAPLEQCAGTRESCPSDVPVHAPAPYPAVVLQPGTLSNANQMTFLGEILAEHGYVVLITSYFNSSSQNVSALRAGLDYILSTPSHPTSGGEVNPYWFEVDRSRVAVAGHSQGGASASEVGYADPRVGTVVLFDPYGLPNGSKAVSAKPTLILHSEYGPGDNQRMSSPPDPQSHADRYRTLKGMGADVMDLTPRATTHQDYAQTVSAPGLVDYLLAGKVPSNPDSPTGLPPLRIFSGSDPGKATFAYSRYSQQVIVYYTLAWFDRYLRGSTDREMARDALRRLTAQVFDASVDSSSIGTGTYDEAKAKAAGDLLAGNQPIKMASWSVSDRLSFYYVSQYSLDGGRVQCNDMRSCGAPGGSPGFEVNVTNGMGGKHAAGEPELAIDPVHHTMVMSITWHNVRSANSNDLTLGDGCGIARSTDGGTTWSVDAVNPADPDPTASPTSHDCSDPVAAAGPGGTLYVGAGWAGGANDYEISVSRSTDGGQTWGPPTLATGNNDSSGNPIRPDRPFLSVDDVTGAVYLGAADFYPPGFQHYVVASHDQGKTFGPRRAIDSPEYPTTTFESTIAAANGMVALSYDAHPVPGVNRCPCAIFETSRDDGATWTRHVTPLGMAAADTASHPDAIVNHLGLYTAVDRSHPGRYAIMRPNGNFLEVSTTANYGATWSTPVLVGQDPPDIRFEPWIDYSPAGVLGIGYKTQYGPGSPDPVAPDDTTFDYWSAISRDGGLTFSAPLRISHATSPPDTPTDLRDDLSSVALDDQYLYAAWGDLRRSPSDASAAARSIYFGRVPLTAYGGGTAAGSGSSPTGAGAQMSSSASLPQTTAAAPASSVLSAAAILIAMRTSGHRRRRR